jgi:hypothetical protein
MRQATTRLDERILTVPATPEPDRIEYCSNGKVLPDHGTFPYPLGHRTSYSACLALVQQMFRTYWRKEGHTLHPMHKGKPLPDLVRVVTEDDTVICQWSKDDELA